MKWKPYPQEPPQESGTYIASIHQPTGAGTRVFNAAAFYDYDKHAWYRTDPYEHEQKIAENISGMVVGWIGDLGNFGGKVK
jgi:hypothetical protein